MAHYTQYACSECKTECSKEEAQGGELVRKVIQFVTLGTPSRIVKSVTTSWVCKRCLPKDADYNREPFRTPGQRSQGLERVRAATARALG